MCIRDRAYNEAREHMEDARMEMEMQAEQSLQQEWGSNYESNMGRAAAVLRRLASETGVDADALMANPGLGSNPDAIRLLYQASRLLDEAPLHHTGNAAPSPAAVSYTHLDVYKRQPQGVRGLKQI